MSMLSGRGQAGDRGDVDPIVAAALREYEIRGGGEAAVITALTDSRLLIPIVATAAEEGVTAEGLRHDKVADVGVAMLQRPDGRRALLAFTSLEALQLWDDTARHSPAVFIDAATMAVEEGATALLIDVNGPVSFVIEGKALKHVAAGHAIVSTSSGLVWLESPL